MDALTGWHPNYGGGGVVRGFWWHCRMDHDAVFSLWTPQNASRKQAKDALLKYAQYYEANEITSLWKTIKPRGGE